MPYKIVGKCIYKKRPDGKTGEKVGCTKGDVQKYMAALQANVKENLNLATVYEILLLDKTLNKLK
jgi:hypothetical protein